VIAALFPTSDRHVECISSDGDTPYATESLLEHDIAKMDLKTTIGSMLVQGWVTGQNILYVDWCKDKKTVTKMVPKSASIGEPGEGLSDPSESYQDIEESTEYSDMPDVWVPATTDVAVLPPTVDCIEQAEIVAICHRFSKRKVKSYIERGIFVNVNADELAKGMESGDPPRSRGKKALEDIGIKMDGTQKIATVYEAHTCMKLGGDSEDAIIWYRGDGQVLGVVKNPNWAKRRPIIAQPVDKVNGVFWGKSRIEPVRFLQWTTNDIMNVGQDAAIYALNPIVMTDPQKNPQWQSMVLTMAAVWPVDPNATKILEFPKLWQDSLQIVAALKAQVRESMGISDYEMGQMPQGRKNNAQVGAVTESTQTGTNDEARDVENRILNPLLEFMFELDTQYRTAEKTIMVMGEVGIRARMERVEPRQFTEKYLFRWLGTEYVQSIQRIQQQIAGMNVLRGLPPQALNGKRIDITPIVEQMVATLWSPRMAPKIIVDERDQLSVPAAIENEMLVNGMAVVTSPLDNDVKHLQEHQAVAAMTGDPSGHFRVHMIKHMEQLQQKSQLANPQGPQPIPGQPPMLPGQQAVGQGMPGGAGPGVPGTPRIGAQPGVPTGGQGPPGMIHQDAMVSSGAMPRG